ncbi:Uncharacterised protein [Bordetella pertussis]|nr:Uncharacterised protein [Bordetella pertussis]
MQGWAASSNGAGHGASGASHNACSIASSQDARLS